jgi:predicted CXXCH cytochrome family protein
LKRYYKTILIYPATVLAVAGLMLLAGDALAGQGCITAKCHQGMLDHKFVHGPVAVQDCLLCHKQTGEHKFTIAAKGAELCYICHDKMPRRHGVECTKCHDPHGSNREFQLKPGV